MIVQASLETTQKKWAAVALAAAVEDGTHDSPLSAIKVEKMSTGHVGHAASASESMSVQKFAVAEDLVGQAVANNIAAEEAQASKLEGGQAAAEASLAEALHMTTQLPAALQDQELSEHKAESKDVLAGQPRPLQFQHTLSGCMSGMRAREFRAECNVHDGDQGVTADTRLQTQHNSDKDMTADMRPQTPEFIDPNEFSDESDAEVPAPIGCRTLASPSVVAPCAHIHPAGARCPTCRLARGQCRKPGESHHLEAGPDVAWQPAS